MSSDISIFFEHGIHIPTRTLYLGSAFSSDGDDRGVDHNMAAAAIKGLHILESKSFEPITAILNSPGGDCTHGLAIYDAIKSCKSHITIHAQGSVCSMAGYILQAGDNRIISPNTVFMFHAGEEGFVSNHPKINRLWVKYNDTQTARLNQILLNRINEKRDLDGAPHMTNRQFEKFNDFDTILTAEETVAWGLADVVKS